MKAKPFKGAVVASLAGKGPSAILTRSEVVALIASRLSRGGDDVAIRNRVSSKLNYDVNRRSDNKLRQQGRGRFLLGVIGVYARGGWPEGDFSDLPMAPDRGHASGTLPALRGTATGYTHPLTLQAASGEILTLRAENRTLAKDRAALQARVRVLEEQVQRYRPGWEKRKRKPAR